MTDAIIDGDPRAAWDRRKWRTPINGVVDPVIDACYSISLVGDQYREDVFTRRELDEYNRDPDLFAAKHFRCVSVEEYREWIRSDQRPLCSERLKRGPMCGAEVPISEEYRRLEYGDADGRVEVWRKLHRVYPCTFHKNLLERREAKR